MLVAHATAEEEKVYPTLRTKRAITAHEEEHGEEEHAEIIEALLEFLEAKGTDTQKYDDALEELATVVNHHSNEEEQTILNPAREDVSLERREELGDRLADPAQPAARAGLRARRSRSRRCSHEAVDEGTLAPEDAREEADEIKADGQGGGQGGRGGAKQERERAAAVPR